MRSLKKLVILLAPVFFATTLVSCGPGRPDMRTIDLNREGNKLIKAQTFPAAQEKYLQALSYDPFIGGLHLNLGLTFESSEQAEKALQSYKEAEALAVKERNPQLVFMARFNQAQLLGKAKRVDEALAIYSKALEIIPTSNETKINIELLTQNGGGQGGGDGKDQKDDQNKDKNKDDKGKSGEDKDQKDKKDDSKDGEDKDKEKEQKPKDVKQSAKYKPRPFAGKELSEGDVKKILGELKQQEEKIRAEYNRKDVKEQPRDKDW